MVLNFQQVSESLEGLVNIQSVELRPPEFLIQLIRWGGGEDTWEFAFPSSF